jgi:DNA-binding Lrp family transcriptional regulator
MGITSTAVKALAKMDLKFLTPFEEGSKRTVEAARKGGLSTGEQSFWTRNPAVAEKLTALKEQGKSPSEIAKELGVTRNAVIGRLDRLSKRGRSEAYTPTLSDWEVGPDGTMTRVLRKRDVGNSRAGKSAMMYNAPDRPLRPFEADYPQGATADVSGRLANTIEGTPLQAQFIVGRRSLGAVDEPIREGDFDRLAEALVGRRTTTSPRSSMGGDSGRTYVRKSTGLPYEIQLASDLRPESRLQVHAHEIGHAIEELAGHISTAGLIKDELQPVFNTLNNPNRAKGGLEAAAWGKPMTPKGQRYSAEEIPREYAAEAIRAYLTNPNYLKSVAPRTAALIRRLVNTNPRLAKTIQFNDLGPLLGAGAAGALYLAGQGEERKRGGGIALPMSTRRESNYSPTRGKPSHHCGSDASWPHGFCEHYMKPNKCALVAGFIAARGGCDWYKRSGEDEDSLDGLREQEDLRARKALA